MHFNILITQRTHHRGKRILEALQKGAAAAGVDAVTINQYKPNNDVLVIYGMGAADRIHIAADHVAAGGRLITWDVGYWDRKLQDKVRRFRFSIDGFHPPKFIFKTTPRSSNRFRKSGLKIMDGSSYNPSGPILLAGNGPKSNVIGAAGWAAAKSSELRKVFPGKQIIYRPKPNNLHDQGVNCDGISMEPTDKAVARASLVVCRHSNLAVDACRLGIPVVCDDGAAASIYPQRLEDYKNQPDLQTRKDFIYRLAWWQWSPNECAEGIVWPWLIEVLNAKV